MASLEDLHADLLISSLAFLHIRDIASIAFVNSMFRAISRSDPLWEELCASLWATKHSQFHLTPTRRENILAAEAEEAAKTTTSGRAWSAPPLPHSSPVGQKTTWKQRCEHSIKDGKRTCLTGPRELSSLVFDFRFRAKPESSVSRNFCFDLDSRRVQGHPNGLNYEWTVDRSGRVVTLGLYPPAHVRRLKNWGWAIVNPNNVLVSTFNHEEEEEEEEVGSNRNSSSSSSRSRQQQNQQ